MGYADCLSLYKHRRMLLRSLKLWTILSLLPYLGCSQQRDSLDKMIGQMILIGLPTNVVDTSSVFYKDIRAGYAGGITMYERHLTPTHSAENLKALIAAYQAIAPIP